MMKDYPLILLAFLALILTGCPDDDSNIQDEVVNDLSIVNNTSRAVELTLFDNRAVAATYSVSGNGELATFSDFDIDGNLVEQLGADSAEVLFDNQRVLSFSEANMDGLFNPSNYTVSNEDVTFFITEAMYNQAIPVGGGGNNKFSLGANNYPLTVGVRTDTYTATPISYGTDVVLYGNGISLDANEDLTGTGDLVFITFFGNNSQDIETGSYFIDDMENPGTALVLYGRNFNIENDFLEDEVLNGTVDISRNGNTYTITASGGPGNFALEWEGVIDNP
jgi:hypothetical protein